MSPLPSICLVLIAPDSSEIRWVAVVPEPGAKLPGRFHGTWVVVDEVVQSGATTNTVFASTAPEGLLDQARDFAADAAERMHGSVLPTIQPRLGQGRPGHHLP